MITTLKENEVFVFGSNLAGFHGAGSAGLACRGDARNTWRTDPWFLKAKISPVGSPARIGKWAVFGVARGLQVGTEGMSYAIVTIERPGWKRSISLRVIQEQLENMAAFAQLRPEYTLLMTPVGAGLAGWSNDEMRGVWNNVKDIMPKNVIYPADLYEQVKILDT
jgi:hypothetical protein